MLRAAPVRNAFELRRKETFSPFVVNQRGRFPTLLSPERVTAFGRRTPAANPAPIQAASETSGRAYPREPGRRHRLGTESPLYRLDEDRGSDPCPALRRFGRAQ